MYAGIGEDVGTTTEHQEVSSAFGGLALLAGQGTAGGSQARSPRLP